MRSLPPAFALAAVLALGGAAVGAPTEPAPTAPEITLTLDTVDVVRPPAGTPGLAFLSGRAFAHEGALELIDVVFVIDTSGSTADASGLGKHSSWLSHLPGVEVARSDSRLVAEVAAIQSRRLRPAHRPGRPGGLRRRREPMSTRPGPRRR
jgi:hypothetical protein